MKEENIKSELTTYMWHIGRVLTELMSVSDSTNSPIIIETFQAGVDLFHTLGKCVYSSLPYDKIYPELNKFIESLDYDSKSSFNSILDYAHDFSKDFAYVAELDCETGEDTADHVLIPAWANQTGYLVEAGNAKELANKMSEFITEPSKISLLGENGFKNVSAFSSENQANKSEDIYHSDQSILSNTFQKYSLILCLGKKMHQECISALYNLRNREDRLLVFMADWVEDNLIQTAKVLWVVDDTINPNDISVGLRNRLPLLVPKKNKYLKTFCTKNNCGLFYDDSIEAQVCLQYLLDNEEIRTSLGINAFRAFYENVKY